jgi:transcription initiation factor TFIIE subunit alpha
VLEPEPVDISTIRGLDKKFVSHSQENWSGEATRNAGFVVEETRVDVTIGDENNTAGANARKEAPIWMMESTVITKDSELDSSKTADSIIDAANETSNNGKTDDIMSVLLAHEKRPSNLAANALKGLNNESDSSSDELNEVKEETGDIENSDSEEDDGIVPTVTVGNRVYNITDINDTIIAEMTQSEKEIYVQVFQDYYSHMNY